MPNKLYLQAGVNCIKIVWEAGRLIFNWRRTVEDSVLLASVGKGVVL